jgi:glycerol uptake facilitator-like aquaporin
LGKGNKDNGDDNASEKKLERGIGQLKTTIFYQALFAELFGTFLLVLFACGFGLPIADETHTIFPESINGALGSGLIVIIF